MTAGQPASRDCELPDLAAELSENQNLRLQGKQGNKLLGSLYIEPEAKKEKNIQRWGQGALSLETSGNRELIMLNHLCVQLQLLKYLQIHRSCAQSSLEIFLHQE